MWPQQCVNLARRQQGNKVVLFLLDLRPGERVARAAEDPVEAIVIACGERIELVIVTTCAGDAETEQRPAQIVNRIFEGQVVLAIAVAAETSSDRQVAGCYNAVAALGVSAAGHQIAGKLFS